MFRAFSIVSAFFGKQTAFKKLSKHLTWVIIAFKPKMNVGHHYSTRPIPTRTFYRRYYSGPGDITDIMMLH